MINIKFSHLFYLFLVITFNTLIDINSFAHEKEKSSFYFYTGSNGKYVHYFKPAIYENLITHNVQIGLEYRLAKFPIGLRYQKEYYFLPVSKLEWGNLWASSITNELILNYSFDEYFLGIGHVWRRKQNPNESYLSDRFFKLTGGTTIDILELRVGINIELENNFLENKIQPEIGFTYFFNDPRTKIRSDKLQINILFGWKLQNEKWIDTKQNGFNGFYWKNGIKAGLEFVSGKNSIFAMKELSTFFVHSYWGHIHKNNITLNYNNYFEYMEQNNMIGFYRHINAPFSNRPLHAGISYTFHTKDGIDQNFLPYQGYIQRYRYHGFSTMISIPVNKLDIELRHDFLFSGKQTSFNHAEIPQLKIFDPDRISLSAIYRFRPK